MDAVTVKSGVTYSNGLALDVGFICQFYLTYSHRIPPIRYSLSTELTEKADEIRNSVSAEYQTLLLLLPGLSGSILFETRSRITSGFFIPLQQSEGRRFIAGVWRIRDSCYQNGHGRENRSLKLPA